MNSHTHYLSAVLVLIAVSFPTSLIGIFIKLNLGKINNILPNTLSYILFVIMVFFTGYIGSINYNISIYFAVLAFIMSFVCIKKNIFFDIVIIFIGVVCEEIIFRHVFFNIAYNILSINIFIVIVLSAFIYSINHIYFGANSVFQKFIVGIIYSLLFVYSSFSITAPLITHFTQNMILYILSSNSKERLN